MFWRRWKWENFKPTTTTTDNVQISIRKAHFSLRLKWAEKCLLKLNWSLHLLLAIKTKQNVNTLLIKFGKCTPGSTSCVIWTHLEIAYMLLFHDDLTWSYISVINKILTKYYFSFNHCRKFKQIYLWRHSAEFYCSEFPYHLSKLPEGNRSRYLIQCNSLLLRCIHHSRFQFLCSFPMTYQWHSFQSLIVFAMSCRVPLRHF